MSIKYIDIYPSFMWSTNSPTSVNWGGKEINVEDSTKMTLK